MGGAQPRGIEGVLVGDRQPVEGAEWFTRHGADIGFSGEFECVLGLDSDYGVDRGVDLVDPRPRRCPARAIRRW
jgi:hypothetical protein